MADSLEKIDKSAAEDSKPAALGPPKRSEDTNKDESPSKSDSPVAAATSNRKCAKCEKKAARKGCTQMMCFTCCEDPHCASHAELREQNHYRDQVLAGNNPIQLLAKEKRAKAIPPGRSKEPGFSFLGDTVVIWDLCQYMAKKEWREDALRKTKKRKARQLNHEIGGETDQTSTAAPRSGKMSRRERFEKTMDQLYQKSQSI